MRAAFLGTPSAAVPSLASLADVADVELVITMPDAARGRSARKQAPPVKEAAGTFGFPVAQPADSAELHAVLEEGRFDVALVVAYGRLLSAETLHTTRFGFVNVHFSLLPRWRGAAPVERAILAGDEVTGVSLMVVNEGLDTGPVVSIVETPIADDETGGSLTARLSYLGAELVNRSLPEFLAGRRDPAPQMDAGATSAPRLTTAEARIDPHGDVGRILRQVRAFNPRPGAWMSVGGRRLKVLQASPVGSPVAAGMIESVGGMPVVGVGGGGLGLERVQAEGKTVVTGSEWLRGRHSDRIPIDP